MATFLSALRLGGLLQARNCGESRRSKSGCCGSTQSPTSKLVASGETLLICQKRKHWNAREKTSAKANRLLLRQASLCVKKWTTLGKANTAPAHPSRRSPLASPKPVGPE